MEMVVWETPNQIPNQGQLNFLSVEATARIQSLMQNCIGILRGSHLEKLQN